MGVCVDLLDKLIALSWIQIKYDSWKPALFNKKFTKWQMFHCFLSLHGSTMPNEFLWYLAPSRNVSWIFQVPPKVSHPGDMMGKLKRWKCRQINDKWGNYLELKNP